MHYFKTASARGGRFPTNNAKGSLKKLFYNVCVIHLTV